MLDFWRKVVLSYGSRSNKWRTPLLKQEGCPKGGVVRHP